MGEHADPGPRLITEILDQVLPLSEYSAEDRLRALVFHLRARAGSDETVFRRTCTEILGIPEPVTTALLHGDIPAARAALTHQGEKDVWPWLASWLAHGDGLAAEYGALAAFHGEYEEIDAAFGARRHLPVSRSMLQRRGYQSSADVEDPTHAAIDPRLATTHAELVEALECLRIRAGDPSLREIAERSETVPEGADTTKHQPRSYNTIHKVLKVEAGGPHLCSVLAFVRGCGVVDLNELAAWEAACTRIRIALHKLPPPRGADQEEGWRAPSGPNPSMA